MKPDILLTQLQKIPEYETELFWYRDKYRESETHPWEKYINQFYLNFNIALPVLSDISIKQQIIGLTLLARDYELVQGSLPGTYHIFIEEIGLLDELKDISKYMLLTFAQLVIFYYHANEKDEIGKLENALDREVQKWNWHTWIKQEEVISILGEKINAASEKVSIPRRILPQVLDDYYTRIDRKRLENLDSFYSKSEKLLNSSENLKSQAHFFSSILNETRNGGENLKSVNDILPHFSGIKYN
jgi:hypothetical protein